MPGSALRSNVTRGDQKVQRTGAATKGQAHIQRLLAAAVCPAAGLDVLDVVISESVVPNQRCLVGRQVKEHCPLAGIQNLASWQSIVLNESWRRRP